MYSAATRLQGPASEDGDLLLPEEDVEVRSTCTENDMRQTPQVRHTSTNATLVPGLHQAVKRGAFCHGHTHALSRCQARIWTP